MCKHNTLVIISNNWCGHLYSSGWDMSKLPFICCLFFHSLSRWSHIVLIILRFELWRGQSMTDSVLLCVFPPSYAFTALAVKEITCKRDHLYFRSLSCWKKKPFRWFCTVDQNLAIIFCVHNSISLDKISNTSGWNEALNHNRAFTVFYRWL